MRYFDGGGIADLRIFNRALTVQEARVVSLWPALERARGRLLHALDDTEREALRVRFLGVEDAGYRSLLARSEAIEREWREMRRRGGVTHVMHERPDAEPEAHVLDRGMYDQPRERVAAGVPAALPPMAASLPRNRLGLARWLVDDANPLTGRVTVNRFWQQVFGTGLVATSEDFGAQGDTPTHPELLDWLASEFRASGWDVKRFFRTLVTSAAYRQSAAATPEKLERDPENRLLSRGPRFRMDAEMVRDYALAASGLLVRAVGGPSVRPYQPEGVWSTVAMPQSNTRLYRQDEGDALYRRSLYTFWKRSAPPPSMEIFNAPTREHFTVRRERTNTPLQALVVMNDPQFVEASRHLAQRALREADGFDARLDFVTGRLLARPFRGAERAVAERTYERLLEAYESDTARGRRASRGGGVGVRRDAAGGRVRRLDDAGEPGAEPGRGAEQVGSRSGSPHARLRMAPPSRARSGRIRGGRVVRDGGRARDGRTAARRRRRTSAEAAEEEVGPWIQSERPCWPRRGGSSSARSRRASGASRSPASWRRTPSRFPGCPRRPGAWRPGADRPRAACRRSRTSRRRRSAASTCT